MRRVRPIAASILASALIVLAAGAVSARPDPYFGQPSVAANALAPSAPHRPYTDVGGPVAPGTVWSAAGSPYRVVSDVSVPAGVTLRIEPGVEIRMGRARTVQIAGAVQAFGTEAEPIVVTPDIQDQPWNSWVVEAGTEESAFEYVTFEKNGARRTAMLEIRSDHAVVVRCLFRDAGGAALDIRDASPRIVESRFIRAASLSLTPAGALRIRGASRPIVRLNFFQSNPNAPIYQDATASPIYDGNRFEYNGWDGASIAGVVTSETRLTSLGPRRWSYWVDAGGITVDPGATLTIEEGATLSFISNGLLVRGTLRVEGQPGEKVVFTSDDTVPQPGAWRDITFYQTSTPYDPETGSGSLIDHAVIEYGGSQTRGVLVMDGASPRISSVLVRKSPTRGASISLASASPLLLGNWFLELNEEGAGEAVVVTALAHPSLGFNVFQDNNIGIDVDSGAAPTIGPFNRFDRNTLWGVVNRDSSLCLAATDNDWGAPEGPDDPSVREDSCGLTSNTSLGDVVSDNVGYPPWLGTLPRPYITSPRCGTVRTASPEVRGMAPPGSTVKIYDNFELLGETTVPASTQVLGEFVFPTSSLSSGGHVFHVAAETPDGASKSGVSDAVEVRVDPTAFVNAAGVHITYDLDGIHYAMGVADTFGCASVGSGEWEIRIHPDTQNPNVAATSTVVAPLECAAGAPTAELVFNDLRIPMTVSDMVGRATFEPGAGGVLGIEATCGGVTRYVNLGPVSIEFEGFVYDKNGPSANPFLDRLAGAQVSLFRADAGGSNWSLWDAASTFGQTNPQTTGAYGWYGWYPPAGLYRVEVIHEEGRYVSRPVHITGQPMMLSIGLGKPTVLLPALSRP